MRKARRRRAASSEVVEEKPVGTVAEHFGTLLGWKQPVAVFHTTAFRECGRCFVVKPGSDFDVPVTPGRPDLGVCRGCSEGHAT
jgi:hypothetical protein